MLKKLLRQCNRAYLLLDQDSNGLSGVLPALSEIKRELEIAARYDRKLARATNWY